MRLRAGLLVLGCALAPLPALAECRQALALGMDVSGSVDADEYRLQLDGLATALTDAQVQNAFLQFPETPVRLMIFEWSGIYDQRVVQDWVPISNATELNAIAARLRATTQAKVKDSTTAISAATTAAFSRGSTARTSSPSSNRSVFSFPSQRVTVSKTLTRRA